MTNDVRLPGAAPTSVILVDDSPLVLETVSAMLTGEGFNVVTASSASEALKLLSDSAYSPDVLVSDLKLGDASGGLYLLETATRNHPGIKGVLMSGALSNASHLRSKGYALLQKPFRAEELISLIARLLGNPEAES